MFIKIMKMWITLIAYFKLILINILRLQMINKNTFLTVVQNPYTNTNYAIHFIKKY